MRVRSAYSNVTMEICKCHHDSPPPWLPPLGRVEDARRQRHDCGMECDYGEHWRQRIARRCSEKQDDCAVGVVYYAHLRAAGRAQS